MKHDPEIPCLHCLIGKVIKAYILEHGIDGVFILDALAEVVGDVLGSGEPDEWAKALSEFNLAAFKRAIIARKHGESAEEEEGTRRH